MKNTALEMMNNQPLLQTKVMFTSIITYLTAMSAGVFFAL